MAALPASELPDLRNIDQYDGELQTKLALRSLALTFVRTNELRSAIWAEIDLDKAEWTIPAARMKTRAAGMHNLDARATMLDIAQRYEAMAQRAEGRAVRGKNED